MSRHDRDRREPGFGYREAAAPQNQSRPRRTRSVLPIILTGIAFIVFAGIILIARGHRIKPASGDVPVIAAATNPIKVKPEQPGGSAILYKDTTVYDQLAQTKGSKPLSAVEHLLQPAEQPMAKPDAPAPAVPLPPTDAATALAPALPMGAPMPAPQPAPNMPAGTVIPPPPTGGFVIPPPIGEETILPPPVSAENVLPPPQSQNVAGSDTEFQFTPPAKPKAEIPATSVAAGGTMIQVGAFRDESAARAEWGRLQGRHQSELGSLSPVIEKADLGAKGIWYRLKGGPMSADDAQRICGALKAANSSCIVEAH